MENDKMARTNVDTPKVIRRVSADSYLGVPVGSVPLTPLLSRFPRRSGSGPTKPGGKAAWRSLLP
jgi:hypothetical protein